MGNTKSVRGVGSANWDHPYIRGEYLDEALLADDRVGSPLHPWGIPSAEFTFPVVERITPTSVGNTFLLVCQLFEDLDHPYIRGEYNIIIKVNSATTGSPLHPWGIPNSPIGKDPEFRITPTSVGNTAYIHTGRQVK